MHISVTKWCIVGYRTGTLWDLWDWSIADMIQVMSYHVGQYWMSPWWYIQSYPVGCQCYHTEAETKWPPFCRQYFSNTIFLYENCCLLIHISLKFVIPSIQLTTIQYKGLCNGLAPNRQQAIIWTNDGLCYWHIYIWVTWPQWVIWKLTLLLREKDSFMPP